MTVPTVKLFKRCAMAAIVIASTAFAASGDASGPAPAFTLTALTGQQAALSQYNRQVAMLNFSSTWCGPCQQEIPLPDHITQKHKPPCPSLMAVQASTD